MSVTSGRPALPRIGLPEKFFAVAAVVAALVWGIGLGAGAKLLAGGVASVLFAVALIRVGLHYARALIWRLRNRLIVAYLFIAVIPIGLILVLTQLSAWVLTRQIGTYLLNAEIDRRVGSLRSTARSLARVSPAQRAEAVRRAGMVFRERLPGLEMLVHDENGRDVRFPEDSSIVQPAPGFGDTAGIVAHHGYFHLWAHAGDARTEVILLVPITRNFLSGLVPGLGDVTLQYFPDPASPQTRGVRVHPPLEGEPPASPFERKLAVPGLLQRLDWNVPWMLRFPLALWDQPEKNEAVLLAMRSPISAVLDLVFSFQPESDESLLLGVLYSAGILFLVVQLTSVLIGINLTRTITSSVHNLYEGTTRIQEGDFSHRIQVTGRDQLAELSLSFNRMTENLERLVQSEKERQRMQAELEIASEVQSQLHPRAMPSLKSLRLTSLCNPARMVSGDYFDYQEVGSGRLALAIGDVAGKGISAALLMASLQSAMRSQLRHCMEAANGNPAYPLSTARLIANLNDQLHASTSPEKYATFFFSVYEEETGRLRYTNAGHLPPLLFRNNHIERLETNGMVVGAFPGMEYGESVIHLEPGDLILAFTDGITEPENAYGEMFGEDRLLDLVRRNLNRPESEIVNLIVDSVRDWTASPELQDDMTLLMARRL